MTQVAAHNRRRLSPRNLHGDFQIACARLAPRPNQRLQPSHCGGRIDVERVEVEPAAPGHLRQRQRQGRCGARPTGKNQGRGCPSGLQPMPGMVVVIAIGQQAQPGRGADCDQGERLGQGGENGQQDRASGGLIGLRCATGRGTRNGQCQPLIGGRSAVRLDRGEAAVGLRDCLELAAVWRHEPMPRFPRA